MAAAGSTAQAFRPAPPRLYYVGADRHLFSMVPGDMRGSKGYDGLGVCYFLNDQGSLVEQWRTEGWYSREVLLSKNGRLLVRLAGEFLYDGPTTYGVAVAFYKDGKLLKSFSTADLVTRPSMLKYGKIIAGRGKEAQWRLDCKWAETKNEAQSLFELRTADQMAYKFDAETGDIVSKVDLIDNSPDHSNKRPDGDKQESEQGTPPNGP